VLSRQFILLVTVIVAIIWFSLLGHRDLIDPDEGRYAEIPREMVASGDWLTPRLNGFKYFEKPVLQYWATAAGVSLFCENNLTARLWPALIGFLGALWAGYLGLRLYGQTAGFYAFVITVSGLLYVGIGHMLSLDMALSVFVAIGIGSLALAQSRREEPAWLRRWMLVGWASLAMAMLTKGLIALVLPAGTVLLYSVWQRDWALWTHLHILKGLLVFMLLAAPWFIAVSLANPEFAQFFFIHEHFARYTSEVHERVAPWWYFIPVFMAGVLPWTAVILQSLYRPLVQAGTRTVSGFDAERFLLVFTLFVLLFFSIGQSKLASYILPVMPVVAVLAGRQMAAAGYRKIDAWSLLLLAVVLLVCAWQATRFASGVTPAAMYIAYRPWFIAASLLLASAALAGFRARPTRPVHVATIGILVLLAFQLLAWGFQSLSGSRSSRELAMAIQAQVPDGTVVYAVANYPQSLPFYLQHTITLVSKKDEMQMGIDLEPERWIATTEEFLDQWHNQEQAVAVFRTKNFARYQQQLGSARVIYNGLRRTAVVKQ
jgi:4-amino-4-deoxy-L-arabinose transferase-like glycosyltransferase